MRRDAIVIVCSKIRFMQRFVAADKFYGSSDGQLDSVLVFNELENDTGETSFSCWICKVLRFLMICKNAVRENVCEHYRTQKFHRAAICQRMKSVLCSDTKMLTSAGYRLIALTKF